MIDLRCVANSKAIFRDRLIQFGLVKADADGNPVGLLPGVEIAEVPCPPSIAGKVAALVRVAHEAFLDQVNNDVSGDYFTKSKLVSAIKTQGTAVTISGTRAWRIGTDFWLVDPRDADRFGSFQ